MIATFGALLGLAGAALMAFRQPVAASAVWLPGNALLLARNLAIGEYQQAALFAAYLAFAAVGLILWRRERLNGQTPNGSCLFHKLGLGKLRADLIAAWTGEPDANAAWKEHLSRFDKTSLACGANWYGDTNGTWHLLEPNGAETYTAVSELLEHFGVPTCRFFTRNRAVEQCIYIRRLASFVQFGLGLPVMDLQRAHQAEGGNGGINCRLCVDEQGREPEDANGGQAG